MSEGTHEAHFLFRVDVQFGMLVAELQIDSTSVERAVASLDTHVHLSGDRTLDISEPLSRIACEEAGGVPRCSVS